MGRAGVTQKLIWRLLGQERREVPRSKLAPTRPGQEYMRRETPSCLSGPSRKTLNLFPEPSVNHEPQSLYLQISSDASRYGFPDTAHMLCGRRFRGTRRLACCLEGQNLVMNSIFFHSISSCQSLSDVSLIKAYSLIPCVARCLCSVDSVFSCFPPSPKTVHYNRKFIPDTH